MRNDYGKGIYNTWRAWWHWHQWAYDFHTTLDTRHPYQSDSPFQWLVQGRPTLFAYTSTPHGPHCAALNGCSQTVLDLGSPAVWWPAILAVLGCVWLWIGAPRLASGARPRRGGRRHPAVAAVPEPYQVRLLRAADAAVPDPRAVRDGGPRARPTHGLGTKTALGRDCRSGSTRCWSSSASGTSTRSGPTSGSRTALGTTGSGSPAGSNSPAGRPAPSRRRAAPSCRACRAADTGIASAKSIVFGLWCAPLCSLTSADELGLGRRRSPGGARRRP